MQNITGPVVTGPDFFPRLALTNWIWERLLTSHILLAAPRRSGKSSIMYFLKDQPKHGFQAVFVNVEGQSGAAQLVTALVKALQEHEAFRSTLAPFKEWAQKMLSREIKLETPIGSLELGQAIEQRWEEAGEILLKRLEALKPEQKLLLLVDEFPILLERLRKKGSEGEEEARQILHWFRQLRQSPASQQGKVRIVFSGSIGLEGVVGRLGASKAINDLEVIRVDPLTANEAQQLLGALTGTASLFADDAARQELLSYLEQPYPYYIQLLFNLVMRRHRSQKVPCQATDVATLYQTELLGNTGNVALRHMDERLDDALTLAEAERVRQALDRVARTSRGLSPTELERLLSGQASAEDGRAVQAGAAIRSASVNALRQLLLHDGYLRQEQGRFLFQTRLLHDFWCAHRGLTRRRS